MAKKFNADSAFEPIEVEIDGKVYEVSSITEEKFSKIVELAKKSQGGDSLDVLCQQMAVFTDLGPETFKACDVRKLAAAIRFISDEIKASAGGPEKNP